jgi:hypothetical protein
MNLFAKQSVWMVLFALWGCGQEVKIVLVEPSSISFTKNTQSQKIEVSAQDIHGGKIPNIPFTFSSEDSSVATVDSGGTVKPAGNGSTAIVAKTPQGITGEAFVKVCLPKDLICDPPDKLVLKVGLAAPIKCHVTDCKDEKIAGAMIEQNQADKSVVLKESDNVFIGLQVGDTDVSIKSGNLEKRVAIHVDEQIYLPGMGPEAPGGKKHGGGKNKGSDDPYGSGRFDHILDNMKFE